MKFIKKPAIKFSEGYCYCGYYCLNCNTNNGCIEFKANF